MTSSPFRCQAAIIDLDGTLVDTLGDFHVALGAAFAELGWPAPARDAVERMIGKGSEHLIRSALEAVGAPARCYDAAWAAYQHAYRQCNGEHSAVYAGVEAGLQGLADRGLALACLTNKPGEFARELLVRTGLARFFRVVHGGDAFERKKPDPLPIVRTCEALGSAPADTLVIGDSANDSAAARAAGCPVLLVTYGYNHGEPVRAVPADGYLDSLAQATDWIARRTIA